MKEEEHSVLIDTSAWVDFFRGTSKTAATVSQLIENGQASICGVIFYELMQGTKSEDEAIQLTDTLSALQYSEMTSDIWIKAGKVSAGLRGEGKTLPMSDLLIGAIALEHNLSVLTLDNHFDKIPGLKRYRGKGDSPDTVDEKLGQAKPE